MITEIIIYTLKKDMNNSIVNEKNHILIISNQLNNLNIELNNLPK
ncbi:hypothetical protein [Myroides sp. LJL110]